MDVMLQTALAPGDVVCMTAAVRDLHRAYPGRFRTAIQTPAEMLWWYNPDRTPLYELGHPEIVYVKMDATERDTRPRHLLQMWNEGLAAALKVPAYPVTEFRGALFLSPEELAGPPFGLPERYWVVMGGAKADGQYKYWDGYQAVVNELRDEIRFVQCGAPAAGHFHPRLEGAVDLVGRTGIREFMQVIYFSSGLICPITFAIHVAAALPRPPRPAVVVAGGRESPHVFAYPFCHVLHTVGAFPCCLEGGCWRGFQAMAPPMRLECSLPICGEHHEQDMCGCMRAISPGAVVGLVRTLSAASFPPT